MFKRELHNADLDHPGDYDYLELLDEEDAPDLENLLTADIIGKPAAALFVLFLLAAAIRLWQTRACEGLSALYRRLQSAPHPGAIDFASSGLLASISPPRDSWGPC